MPRGRFPYDSYDTPALDVRIQAQGGQPVDFSGTVDSGASTTVLSKEHATVLGLDLTDLRKAPDAIVADNKMVNCWSTATQIHAQVLRPVTSGDLQPWGPVFPIYPVFLEHASPLWGQADFFDTFEITFWRYDNPRAFGLSY